MSKIPFRVLMISLIVLLGVVAAVRLLRGQPRIAFIGYSGSSLMMLDQAGQETGIRVAFLSHQEMVKERLKRYGVIYLNLHGTHLTEPMVQALDEAKAKGTRVIASGGDVDLLQIQKFSNVDVARHHPKLSQYWEYGGLENYKRFLTYLTVKFNHAAKPIQDPVPTPEDGLYHPAAKEVFASYEGYLAWYQGRSKYHSKAPTIVLYPASGWKSGDTATINDLVHRFEEKGANVFPLFGRKQVFQMIKKAQADLVIDVGHGRWAGGKGVEFLKESDLLLLKGISLRFGDSISRKDWEKGSRGMGGGALAVSVAIPELDGMIEPLVISSVETTPQGYTLETPIPERADRLVERALGWVRLKRTPNPEKRMAVIYYKSNKGHIGGGGLDVPPSLVNFLKQMKARGYRIGPIPDPEGLRKIMDASGSNVSAWAPGDLERLAQSKSVLLLEVETYRQWFKEALSPENQRRVLQAHGEPPGKGMVYRKGEKAYLVIPKIDLGNVILLPQPSRGGDEEDEAIYGRGGTPPPHQYLAAYLWLDRGFKAHALLHYGTHGNLEFLPGKQVGLSQDDWSDLLLGGMPNVYLYIMDDVGEALTAKRRSYAAITSHLTPPIVTSEIYGELMVLQDLVRKFKSQEDGAVREEYRASITQKVREMKLEPELEVDLSRGLLSDEQVQRLANHLHHLAEEKIPVGLHVHGQVPPVSALVPILTEMLGSRFLEDLSRVIRVEGKDEAERREALRKKGQELLKLYLTDGLPAEQAIQRMASPGRI